MRRAVDANGARAAPVATVATVAARALTTIAAFVTHAALALLSTLGALLPAAAATTDIPYLTGRVVDTAEILSAPARQQIEATLKAQEAATGNQVAVLTVRSLDGSSVEQFATDVFAAWKLGQKGKDNGVLLLISPGDRRLRIEVGYGLEGTLTDVAAARIIRNVITPRFKDGNYDAGVREGVAAIIGQLDGTAAVPDAPAASGSTSSGGASSGSTSKSKAGNFEIETPDMPWMQRILIGAFIFGILSVFTIVGVMTPGFGWFLYLFLIPFWAMFPIVVVGTRGAFAIFAVYIVGYPVAKLILRRQPWYEKASKELKTKGSASVGGWVITSGSGSSGSSGSSDSGGSSGGGGGSSGGGGASGSW